MRQLRQFRVDRDMMRLFYHSFVESILCFCSVAWYFSLSVANKNKLNKIINMASKIACQPLNSMAMTVETRVAKIMYKNYIIYVLCLYIVSYCGFFFL